MFDWLKKRGFNKQLLEAVKNGNREQAERLLAEGADKDLRDKNGLAPIHHAAEGGHLAVLDLLVNAGADLAAKVVSSELTALHIAARRGDASMVKQLVAAGVDKEAKDKEGFRPIHFAAQKGCAESVKALAEAGAEIDARARSGFKGWSALELAIFGGRLEIVQCLIAAGANKEAKDDDGYTALNLAAGTGEEKIAECLLDAGADGESNAPDEPDKSELVPDAQVLFVLGIAKFMESVILDPGGEQSCYGALCSATKDLMPAACLWSVLTNGKTPRFIDDYLKDSAPQCDRRAEAKSCARAMLRAVTMERFPDKIGQRVSAAQVFQNEPRITWFIRMDIKAARRSASTEVNVLLNNIMEGIGLEHSQSVESRSV